MLLKLPTTVEWRVSKVSLKKEADEKSVYKGTVVWSLLSTTQAPVFKDKALISVNVTFMFKHSKHRDTCKFCYITWSWWGSGEGWAKNTKSVS